MSICKGNVWSLAFLLVMNFGLLKAQAPIKQHVIGETVQQFLSISDGMATRVGVCRYTTDKKLARKYGLNLETCQRLVSAIDNGTRIQLVTATGPTMSESVPMEFNGSVTFDQGKLAEMEIDLGDSWDRVYADLVKRFGPATHVGENTYQNAYGATYHGSEAGWVSPLYLLTAHEKISNTTFGIVHSVLVDIETKQEADRAQMVEAQRKSTLE